MGEPFIVSHRECEDPRYSCPKSANGCADDREGPECNCDADRVNAELTTLRARLAQVEGEAKQLRELLNCYNLGGWTDADRLIKERDEARASQAVVMRMARFELEQNMASKARAEKAEQTNARLREALRGLCQAIDAMMAPLGYHGSISARDDRVEAVMDALARIDEDARAALQETEERRG